MKCLANYEWVKIMRIHLPQGKGILGAWAKIASRAAFRKGYATYCGYINKVNPGMWAGGIVGLKSILGIKSKQRVLEIMDKLSELGYISYKIDSKTKKLTYCIKDWVVKCSGAECVNGNVYASDGYGFLPLPRNITERLISREYIFEEADAWMDLWCHSISNDPNNAFSFLAPIIQYGKRGAALTLETLGQRWGWEKTKVWRFFKKHGDAFALYRLPGSYGCLIFNKLYPADIKVSLVTEENIASIINILRTFGAVKRTNESDNRYLNRLLCCYSRTVVKSLAAEESADQKSRVAKLSYIIRAYFSHCRNCRYDCKVICHISTVIQDIEKIRGPCRTVNLETISKEFTYG